MAQTERIYDNRYKSYKINVWFLPTGSIANIAMDREVSFLKLVRL